MIFKADGSAGHLSWQGLISASRRGRLDKANEFLDLAPFVDIIFTLILFFMLTSPFITQWGIKVNLPSARNITTLNPAQVEIIISPDNRIFIREREFTLAELHKELFYLATSNQPVAIMSDYDASWGITLEVWDAAKEAGIKQLNVRARVKTTQ